MSESFLGDKRMTLNHSLVMNPSETEEGRPMTCLGCPVKSHERVLAGFTATQSSIPDPTTLNRTGNFLQKYYTWRDDPTPPIWQSSISMWSLEDFITLGTQATPDVVVPRSYFSMVLTASMQIMNAQQHLFCLNSDDGCVPAPERAHVSAPLCDCVTARLRACPSACRCACVGDCLTAYSWCWG